MASYTMEREIPVSGLTEIEGAAVQLGMTVYPSLLSFSLLLCLLIRLSLLQDLSNSSFQFVSLSRSYITRKICNYKRGNATLFTRRFIAQFLYAVFDLGTYVGLSNTKDEGYYAKNCIIFTRNSCILVSLGEYRR